MKSKIVEIDKHGCKVHLSVSIDPSFRNNLRQFKADLFTMFDLSATGNHGFSQYLGSGVDFNVFRGENYAHIVLYTSDENNKIIMDLFFKYFACIEPITNDAPSSSKK